MLKQLWIMRHGLAKSEFTSDFERELSEVGAKQAQSVVRKWLLDNHDMPDKMLISPFKRTQQTAHVVLSEMDCPIESETEEMLVHFADHRVLASYLLSQESENLWVVSHMPIVARLTAYLTNNDTIAGFETAQLVGVKFDGQGADVNYVYRHGLI
ncbi:MAG: phosphohistidine phosphatase SixA [Gammaproteobacteria bacterium]|nr:phosphohistidine phosphatase SixA [Gammaproteobacteria bacterium]MDH5628906.1 phosphohistidine phosphatase SixA [Gammaproteobacteria bacterium]